MLSALFACLLALAGASVRGLIVLAFAFAVLRILRLRDANLKHRVWAGVVVGMLVLPFLSGLLPPIPLPIHIIPAFEPFIASEETQSQSIESLANATGTRLLPERGLQTSINVEQDADAIALSDPMQQRRYAMKEVEESPFVVASSPTSASSTTARIDGGARLVRVTIVGVFVVWIVGVLVLAARLIIGLIGTLLLRKRSDRVDISVSSIASAGVRSLLCSRLSSNQTTSGRRKQISDDTISEGLAVSILSNAAIAVPVTVGWWRPAVLLPTVWREWSAEKLEAVLAHELTHVDRRDFAVAVLAEINRCIYWFHPAAWWLRRELSDLAEAACDDAAIRLTDNPTGYARHLLEVASSLVSTQGCRVQPGLSMARESNVESRIVAILDFSRPLSRRLTWKAAALLFLIAMPVIGLAAALKPGQEATNGVPKASPSAKPVDPSTKSEMKTGGSESRSTKTLSFDVELDKQQLRLRGQVVDESGSPIVTAKVRLLHVYRAEHIVTVPTAVLITEIPVDSEGRFDTTDKIPAGIGPFAQKFEWLSVVVGAPGFACGGPLPSPEIERAFVNGTPIQIVLPQEVAIKGRIINLEGQPVANASVRVHGHRRGDPEKLTEWLSRASKTPPSENDRSGLMMNTHNRENSFPGIMNLEQPFPESLTKTDSDGRFELRGLSEHDLLHLYVEGAGIARQTLQVLGRDTAVIFAKDSMISRHSRPYYGRNFTFVAEPGVRVFGIVRDAATRKPIPDLHIAVRHVRGELLSQENLINTQTDKSGFYEFTGLPAIPKGTHRTESHHLVTRPGQLPYIEEDFLTVPVGDGTEKAIEFDIELRQAVIAKGRLTDRTTGQPVQAKLYYSPFRSNPNVVGYQRFSDDVTMMLGNDSRYRTDINGNFEIPVIPGRGVIAAKCDSREFVTAFGASEIPEFKGIEPSTSPGAIPTSDYVVPSIYHAIKAVDVPLGVTDISVDMQVDPGISLKVRFVDSAGKPVSGVFARGLNTPFGGGIIKEDHVLASAFLPGKTQPVFVSQRDLKLYRLLRLVPEPGQTEVTIQLLKPAIVTGRLVDAEGLPLARVHLEAMHENDPDFVNQVEANPSDSDGRFSIELPVGAEYQIRGMDKKAFLITKDLDVSEPQRIDMGDMVVDPEKDDFALVKAMREPIVTPITDSH